MHGKVGYGASSDRARFSAQPGAPAIGKRTLVEQVAAYPAAVATAAPAGGASATGLPRLQLKDIPAQPSATVGTSAQRKPGHPDAAGGASPDVTPPKAGINQTGFIDHSDGANLRTGPAESGGQKLRDQPLPPATRVFVSGTHPDAPAWWYVTSFLDGTMVRGYVQDFRVTTDLPEPLAELRQLVGGETPEGLAREKFGDAVTDGHDLRYYENVLLYVNRGRAGIAGTYQDPGILGGGDNHIRLVAGHRIWLVSAAYAKALEVVVPSGSLTGGAVGKARRFVGHLEDILHSVTRSPQYFDEVAGEYAQAIRDHLPEIVGIVAGFVMAEATSAFLAATPTGVGQIAAVVIQLGLSAFGAASAIQTGAQALQHASEWLTIAWTAKGKDDRIAAASKEFLRMLVSIAIAALSALGAKANYGNALTIARSMPTGGLPALAVAGGKVTAGASADAAASIRPGVGGIGAAGAYMTSPKGDGLGSESPEAPTQEPSRTEAHAGEASAHVPGDSTIEPHGPQQLTKPSGKPDLHAGPAGRRATPSPTDRDPTNIRALARENESADVLARQGYRVEQNPAVPGRKNPDFRIEGQIFDNYAPTTSSPRSIWTAVRGKVVQEQARRIVLNLSSSEVELAKLKAQFDRWPIDNLEQIIVVKGEFIIRFWP